MPAPTDVAPERAWTQATQAPFLDAVRDGSLPTEAFDTWLVQDALFVGQLLSFQARLLARAPRAAQEVLAAGVMSLVQELDWFEGLAHDRDLRLDAPPTPVTQDYADLLVRLDRAPYAVAVTALWVLERVYLLAWQHAAPGASAFRGAVAHWTAPGFADYVVALGALADAAGAPPDAVGEVLALEARFWPQTP